MKGAIFHDYFSTIGGGEKVVLAIAKHLHADIITTENVLPKSFFNSLDVHNLGDLPKTPGFHQLGAMYRFEHSDIHELYDYFIFSGNWAHHASKHHTPSLYYCNTPVRAIYDLYPVFLKREPIYRKPLYTLFASYIRRKDQKSIKRISHIVTNSVNIQDRIQRYYHRTADVIYPPVDTARYSCIEYGDFWLSVNRIYPEKRIEMQIEAFSKLPEEKLIIVGGFSGSDHSSSYATYIKSLISRNPNIHLLGQISEQELLKLYATCKALICTALDEDFGMTPLEAMASGKPVVAVREGGFLETVTSETGVFINPTANDLISAIKKIRTNLSIYQEICQNRAREFDISVFNIKIDTAISKLTKVSI